MARDGKTATTAKRKPAQAPAPADSRDGLSVGDLARGILSKDIRPRLGDIRRLAEAVLAGRGAKPRKGKKDKADGGKKAKGKTTLARIPGQKGKK